MPGAAIDRLVLDAPGLSRGDARRVALAVAAGLARATGLSGDVPLLRVTATAGARDDIDGLAERIVADALRQLRERG